MGIKGGATPPGAWPYAEKMKAWGAKAGGNNRPPNTRNDLDENEIEVTSVADWHVNSAKENFRNKTMDIQKETNSVKNELDDLKDKANAHLNFQLIRGAFDKQLADDDSGIVDAYVKEKETSSALGSFKSKNNIELPAKYPDDQLYHFSLLLLCIVIETVANAFFYEGSSGLLGGAVVALSVSIINMSIAVLSGALFRYINLPNLKHNLMGYGAGLLFVFLGIFLNLIFATFRVQYELIHTRVSEQGIDPSTAILITGLKQAVIDASNVFHLIFPPIDFVSFTLFFVGFGCSIFAFWKGYTWDDKYPGHGSLDRLYEKSKKDLENLVEATRNNAKNIMNNKMDESKTLQNEFSKKMSQIGVLRVQADEAINSFRASMDNIRDKQKHLLEVYRNTNRAIRSTPPPPYFAEMPNNLPDQTEQNNSHRKIMIHLESLKQNVLDCNDIRQKLADKLKSDEAEIAELMSSRFPKWLNELCNKADNQMAKKHVGQAGMTKDE